MGPSLGATSQSAMLTFELNSAMVGTTKSRADASGYKDTQASSFDCSRIVGSMQQCEQLLCILELGDNSFASIE